MGSWGVPMGRCEGGGGPMGQRGLWGNGGILWGGTYGRWGAYGVGGGPMGGWGILWGEGWGRSSMGRWWGSYEAIAGSYGEIGGVLWGRGGSCLTGGPPP